MCLNVHNEILAIEKKTNSTRKPRNKMVALKFERCSIIIYGVRINALASKRIALRRGEPHKGDA